MTLDSDTFFSLTVTGMHDPMTLKAAIVKKLGLASTFLDQYQFYHENGDNSGKHHYTFEKGNLFEKRKKKGKSLTIFCFLR